MLALLAEHVSVNRDSYIAQQDNSIKITTKAEKVWCLVVESIVKILQILMEAFVPL